ncbi:MAG: hypothetical protein KGN84_00225 [Acidobacteriota bacterium]|nr:hypothetical protein [Acidobacteriota bacterium]
MWRSVLGFIAGYLVLGLLISCSDFAFSFEIPHFNDGQKRPDYYYLTSIVTDALFSVVGGWICALIARIHARLSILFLIAFGELAGLAATIWNWGVAPHYFSYALLILYPPAIWFGGQLRMRGLLNRAAAA